MLNLSQVGCVTYSSSAQVDFLLNAYSTASDVTSAIAATAKSNRRTNIADALRQTRENIFQVEWVVWYSICHNIYSQVPL